MPLANDYRPNSLDEIVGQEHLVGEGKVFRQFLTNQFLPNMIFHGPTGTGKTTIAKILASRQEKQFVEMNGVNVTTDDIRQVLKRAEREAGIVLFIDEIQYLNKKIQQTILESIELGNVTLIAATADNPYFVIYKALRSRCSLFEFHSLQPKDIEKNLYRILDLLCKEKSVKVKGDPSDILQYLSQIANGDVRNSINNLELCFYMGLHGDIVELKMDDAREVASSQIDYDNQGNMHYDLLSAFHKSLRGSDPDASIYYLANLLQGEGHLNDICRRLLCVASEDVGLANLNAISIVKACVDSALQLGMPEARLPLAEATIFLARCPKSNATYLAIDRALQDVQQGKIMEIPDHIRYAHYEGNETIRHGAKYQYPHNFPNHYVDQQYMEEHRKYYEPQGNKTEQAYEEYWRKIKKEKRDS